MLKKLAPYTRGYGLYILLGVLCSVGESVLELELPQAMSEIVDVGIANGDRSYILLTGLKMFLMAMAGAAVRRGCGGAGRQGGHGLRRQPAGRRSMSRCSASPSPTSSASPLPALSPA